MGQAALPRRSVPGQVPGAIPGWCTASYSSVIRQTPHNKFVEQTQRQHLCYASLCTFKIFLRDKKAYLAHTYFSFNVTVKRRAV